MSPKGYPISEPKSTQSSTSSAVPSSALRDDLELARAAIIEKVLLTAPNLAEIDRTPSQIDSIDQLQS